MNKIDKQLLKRLMLIPSPSGYEDMIAKFIKAEVSNYVNEKNITIDHQKNVIVRIPGKTKKKVIIDAHSDTIGFLITNVNRWGTISIDYIGGGETTILSARHLSIMSEKGVVNAIVDKMHSHLTYDDSAETIWSIEDAELDIGIKDRDAILKLIQIGDPVVFTPDMRDLTDDYLTGYGFDDKAGCYMLIKAIQQIAKSKVKPDCELIFVFSAQEETGTSKLLPIVRREDPDLVIELDVTFGTDYSDMDSLEAVAGRCHLGKGVALYRGVDLDEKCYKLATKIAKANDIPFQVQAGCGNIGYTSLSMTGEGSGIKAMVFGIPLRGMHMPTEVINGKDLDSGSTLLAKFLKSRKLKDTLNG